MEINLEPPINEQLINSLIEKHRRSFSRNLNDFLILIKTSDPFKNKGKIFQTKDRFFQDIFPVYDKNGKISWDIIRMFMPPDFEKSVKQAYPILCENEVRLSCLLIFDVPPKNILNILTYNNPKTIYSTSFAIRQKADVKEIREIFKKINLNQTSIL